MKKLLLMLCLIPFMAMGQYKTKNDSIRILKDSIEVLNGKLAKQNNTIKYADFDSQFKLIKIKRYVYLCERRPTNKKYFFGWIRRTLNN